MTLRSQLILIMLACCIVPMGIVSWIVDGRTDAMTSKTVETCGEHLDEQLRDALTHIRESYQEVVTNKLESIGNEVSNFAVNPSVQRALFDFKEAVRALRREPDADGSQKRALQQFYASFTAAADKQGTTTIAPHTWLAKLDPTGEALQQRYIAQNPHPLGEKHRFDGPSPQLDAYDAAHANFHPYARKFLETFGYYDVFLVEPEEGRVVYSTFKEVDFGVRLNDGLLSDSGLSEAFRKASAAAHGAVVMTDYRGYAPSYGKPAAFVASPIHDDGKLAGVAIFQFSIETINKLLAPATEDMSEETMLIGSDGLMRSDSHLAPTTHSVQAAWRNPETSKIDNAATQAMFGKHETGYGSFTDQRGKEVLASWAPISVFGLTWGIIRKVDIEAAKAATVAVANLGQEQRAQLRTTTLTILAISALLCAALAYFLATRSVRPILNLATNLKSVAEGEADLTQRLAADTKTELGTVGHWFNVFMARLQDIVSTLEQEAGALGGSADGLLATATQQSSSAEQTKAQASQVAAAAEEMSINLRGVGDASERMSSSIRSVAAAVEEMTTSIADVAGSASRAATVADSAADLVRENNDRISKLGLAADEIGRVIEAIQDIAEQTNLLALNATIEAARAGDAGKGFSVVAGEVKELARQTAEATEDIRRRIEGIQNSTGSAIEGTARIADIIVAVNEASRAIARSVAEQQSATQDISNNISSTSQQVDTVVRNVQESAFASREITESIARVDAICSQSVAASSGTRAAGQRVHGIAQELTQHLANFKVS